MVSAELSMKKDFITSRPDFLFFSKTGAPCRGSVTTTIVLGRDQKRISSVDAADSDVATRY